MSLYSKLSFLDILSASPKYISAELFDYVSKNIMDSSNHVLGRKVLNTPFSQKKKGDKSSNSKLASFFEKLNTYDERKMLSNMVNSMNKFYSSQHKDHSSAPKLEGMIFKEEDLLNYLVNCKTYDKIENVLDMLEPPFGKGKFKFSTNIIENLYKNHHLRLTFKQYYDFAFRMHRGFSLLPDEIDSKTIDKFNVYLLREAKNTVLEYIALCCLLYNFNIDPYKNDSIKNLYDICNISDIDIFKRQNARMYNLQQFFYTLRDFYRDAPTEVQKMPGKITPLSKSEIRKIGIEVLTSSPHVTGKMYIQVLHFLCNSTDERFRVLDVLFSKPSDPNTNTYKGHIDLFIYLMENDGYDKRQLTLLIEKTLLFLKENMKGTLETNLKTLFDLTYITKNQERELVVQLYILAVRTINQALILLGPKEAARIKKSLLDVYHPYLRKYIKLIDIYTTTDIIKLFSLYTKVPDELMKTPNAFQNRLMNIRPSTRMRQGVVILHQKLNQDAAVRNVIRNCYLEIHQDMEHPLFLNQIMPLIPKNQWEHQ